VLFRSHAAIVDAIEARDEQAAAAAMLEAIDIGYRRINDSSRRQRGQKR
jgi:DNA-binding FadR family transcriptional regulator